MLKNKFITLKNNFKIFLKEIIKFYFNLIFYAF